MDKKVKEILKNPIFQKDGELFLFEVENPLVLDHFKEKVKKLGYLSDGSFSPGIVRLSLNAIVAIIDDSLTEQKKKKVKDALLKAGAPDSTFKGVLKGVLKNLGKRIAKDAGEELAEKVGDFLSPLIDASTEKITSYFQELFHREKE